MTVEELKRLFPHASRSTVLANFTVGQLAAQVPQSDQRREGEDRRVESRPARMGFRITIIQFRRRLLDNFDNRNSSVKPLVDAIGNTLGFSNDNDSRLDWNCHQVQTRGRQGVIVLIEPL